MVRDVNLEFQSDMRGWLELPTGVLRRWKVFNSMILDEGTEEVEGQS